jgi:hypothetical protein
LPAPDVQYSQKNKPSREIGVRGSWNHQNLKFVNTPPVKRWIVINLANYVKKDMLYSQYGFIDVLIQVGRGHGINISEPVNYIQNFDNLRDEDIRRLFHDAVSNQNLDLVLVVLPDKSYHYKMIKTLGDLKYGIATQIVKDKNVKPNYKTNEIDTQKVSNILLKINTKLGGTNFVISHANSL